MIKWKRGLLIYWKNSFDPMIQSSEVWSSDAPPLKYFNHWATVSSYGYVKQKFKMYQIVLVLNKIWGKKSDKLRFENTVHWAGINGSNKNSLTTATTKCFTKKINKSSVFLSLFCVFLVSKCIVESILLVIFLFIICNKYICYNCCFSNWILSITSHIPYWLMSSVKLRFRSQTSYIFTISMGSRHRCYDRCKILRDYNILSLCYYN